MARWADLPDIVWQIRPPRWWTIAVAAHHRATRPAQRPRGPRLVRAEVPGRGDPGKHAPTIGILLCTGKNEAVVRFTLANMTTALGVADYEGLPADVKAAVPPPDELQAAFGAKPLSSKASGPGPAAMQPETGTTQVADSA